MDTTMIYDYPQYYEVAFSFRDIPKEARFIKACIDQFSHIEVDQVFEVASGYAPHAAELARLGYRYLGLDNNSHMLKYAKERWQGLSPAPEFLTADMVSFEIEGKTDFAFVMLGSLYLNTIEEINSHFDSVAQALRPGGLYFLDGCIQFEDPMKYAENNAIRLEQNGISVESRFDIRLVDPEQNMYEEIWTLDINDRGSKQRLQMTECNKAIFPDDFMALVNSRTDFEFVGWWRDWDFSQPIDNKSKIVRPIALLRRR